MASSTKPRPLSQATESRRASSNYDHSLRPAFSGDAGGAFGGAGGMLDGDQVEGWCTRTDTQRAREEQEREQEREREREREREQEPSIEKDLESQEVEDGKKDEDQEEEMDEDEFLVRFTDDDVESPKNLANWRKWACTYIVSSASLCVTCASSIYVSAYGPITNEFHVPQLEAVAGLSLFVIGLGIGPMVLAPLSEFYGRRPIYLASFFWFVLLLLPCALAPNIAVLLVFRFLNGMAGSAFLSVAGGTVGDMFSGRELGAPMMIYTASPFIGPEFGPLIGGFINQNIDWRWTFWIIMIWAGAELAAIFFLVPETYHPVLLRQRAISLRSSTGDSRYHAPIEKMDRTVARTIAWSCLRPFQLLIYEPMVLLLCTFTALLLGVLYLFFQAFPLVFRGVHGFDLQTTGLTFLGLFIGMVLGILSDPVWKRVHGQLLKKHAHKPSQPEYRLPSAILGAVLVPIGLFWFAWSTYAHWILPIVGSAFFGLGTLLMFSSVFTFLVEAYPLYAASALAANSFVRSSFAAGFPLFSAVLYERLGYRWAGSLLGFLTLPMAPVMLVFFLWGERIRRRSRYAGGKH